MNAAFMQRSPRVREANMDWKERVTSDEKICHGQACIRGTRIPVSVVLDNLAAGLSPEEIVKSYPALCLDDVRATMSYAAEIAREHVLPIKRTA
jgi:uncharacterized protein (DUF433 family)